MHAMFFFSLSALMHAMFFFFFISFDACNVGVILNSFHIS